MLNHSIYENDKTCRPHIVAMYEATTFWWTFFGIICLQTAIHLSEHIPINCCIGVKFNYHSHMVKLTNDYQWVGYSKCCWTIFFFIAYYACNSHGHALVHRMPGGLHMHACIIHVIALWAISRTGWVKCVNKSIESRARCAIARRNHIALRLTQFRVQLCIRRIRPLP